jgi:hypothetical protein
MIKFDNTRLERNDLILLIANPSECRIVAFILDIRHPIVFSVNPRDDEDDDDPDDDDFYKEEDEDKENPFDREPTDKDIKDEDFPLGIPEDDLIDDDEEIPYN